MVRWLRAIVYGASGLICLACAFFAQARSFFPGGLLLIIGIAFVVPSLHRLKADRQLRVEVNRDSRSGLKALGAFRVAGEVVVVLALAVAVIIVVLPVILTLINLP